MEKSSNYIILENSGIGYKVFVTPATLECKIAEEVKLYIYHKVSEDGQSLFGLPDFETLQFFELLITVSGVGPKAALAILSASRPDAVKQAILNQDPGMFTRISGVGTKTAEKIIVELKNKVGTTGININKASGEVFDALLALGYNQREVREVISKLNSEVTQGEQIKQALRLLGKS